MEQNENMENNGFENFEDAAKYTSIGDYYGKKADFYARISIVFLGLAAFLTMGVGYILSMLVGLGYISAGGEGLSVFESIIGWVSIVCYFVSLMFAIKGYRVKKTKLSKLMFFSDLLIPLYLFMGMMVFLFLFWGIFGIFITGGASFWEFLMELFF